MDNTKYKPDHDRDIHGRDISTFARKEEGQTQSNRITSAPGFLQIGDIGIHIMKCLRYW